MTIKKKLIMTAVVLMIMFLIIVSTAWYGFHSINAENAVTTSFERETMYLQGLLRGMNEFIIDEGEPLSVKLANDNLSGFDGIHKSLMTDVKSPELQQVLIQTIDPKWQNLKGQFAAFLKIKPISVNNDEAMMRYGKLTAEAKSLLSDEQALAGKSQEIANTTARKTQYTIIAVVVITLTGIIFLLKHLYHFIVTPLRELNTIAEGFSRGDLSLRMDDSREGEIGKLAYNLNNAIEKLGGLISNLSSNIHVLTSDAEKSFAATMQIAEHSKEQSSQTTNAATAMEELSATFIDVAKNTNIAAQSAKEAVELANNGRLVVNETINGMSRIAKSVNKSADTIEALGKASEQIGEIINVINDIASQTNLLALNAAIEAARAGEQGRGFAVVADEVRKLAERTTSATKEIGDMIKSIQNDTKNAVESMQSGTKEVDTEVELANQAGQSLSQILEAIKNVTDMVQQIAAAVEEQSSAGEEISSNLEGVANITRKAVENAQTSSQLNEHLSSVALEVNSLVGEFKVTQNSDTAGS
ncbi:MAG: HAMP domain-containing protein [Nitrospirae bacterium]|nr:HAMP domain-containing protein [Nitrospirota bacterium]